MKRFLLAMVLIAPQGYSFDMVVTDAAYAKGTSVIALHRGCTDEVCTAPQDITWYVYRCNEKIKDCVEVPYRRGIWRQLSPPPPDRKTSIWFDADQFGTYLVILQTRAGGNQAFAVYSYRFMR